MLVEHRMLARPYPDVRSNCLVIRPGRLRVDLAFEVDELHRIVDLM